MSYAKGTAHELTYAVEWKCHRCGASGTVEIPTAEGCGQLFALVLEAHRQDSMRAADCDAVYGNWYLAITPPRGKDGDPR